MQFRQSDLLLKSRAVACRGVHTTPYNQNASKNALIKRDKESNVRHVNVKYALASMVVAALVGTVSNASAQTQVTRSPWNIEFGVGFDNDISGNINGSGVGTINGQTVVITRNTYEEVYGTGLHLRGGVGYLIDGERTELRATVTFQSLDADFIVPIGDIGVSNLYAQYSDYQSLTLDVGARRYRDLATNVRVYGEGTVGLGFVDKIDAQLIAPGANLTRNADDFYDQTVALSFAANAGVLFETSNRVGVFAQLGLRWVSGLAEVDDLVGTGLDTINDKSSRWTLPFVTGVRFGF